MIVWTSFLKLNYVTINPSLALILAFKLCHATSQHSPIPSSTIYEFLPYLSHEGLRMYWSQPESFYVSHKLKRFAVLSLKLTPSQIDASYNSRTEPDAAILTWYNIIAIGIHFSYIISYPIIAPNCTIIFKKQFRMSWKRES